MRKILLLALLLLPQLLQAQIEDRESLPLLELGRSWNYFRTNADGSLDVVSLKLERDTMIGKEKAYILSYCTPEKTITRFALQEPKSFHNAIVVSYDLNSGEKQGFYPSQLWAGMSSCDWCMYYPDASYTQVLPGMLREFDQTEANGIVRERCTFYEDTDAGMCKADIWINGIGSQKSGILIGDRLADVVGEDALQFVSLTKADGTELFRADDFELHLNTKPSYRKLAEDKKVWYCASFPSGTNRKIANHYQYFTDGDTLINGQDCYKLYGQNHYMSGKVEYLCGIYEKDRQVWFIEKDSETPRLLYDFSMDYDDMMELSFEKIEGKGGTIIKNGDEYFVRDQQLWHAHLFGKMVSIEGVGSTRGLLTPLMAGVTGGEWRLLLCTVDGEMLYDAHMLDRDEVLSLSYPDTHEIKSITKNTYDLSGRRVKYGELHKGVYIQGGKKFVVK